MKGVTYISSRKEAPWRAKHYCKGKEKHIGFYNTEEDAIEALTDFLNEKEQDYTEREKELSVQALKWVIELVKIKTADGTIDKFMSDIDIKTDDQLFSMFVSHNSKSKKENVEVDSQSKRLISQTSLVFADWMDSKTSVIMGNTILGKTLYDSFILENEINEDQLSAYRFYKWLDCYGEIILGQKTCAGRVSSGRKFKFSFDPSKIEVKL